MGPGIEGVCPLSLHDALPICSCGGVENGAWLIGWRGGVKRVDKGAGLVLEGAGAQGSGGGGALDLGFEEHGGGEVEGGRGREWEEVGAVEGGGGSESSLRCSG